MTSIYYRRYRRKRYKNGKLFWESVFAFFFVVRCIHLGNAQPKTTVVHWLPVPCSFYGGVISLRGAEKQFPVLAEEEYDSVLVDWSIDYDPGVEGESEIPVFVRREISADQTISTTTSN